MVKREQIIGLCALLALTAAAAFWDAGRPARPAHMPSEGEGVYTELLEAAPLAAVEGETASPDQRFFVRTVGATDIYVSGVRVPEKIQVVDRETEEVLWEEDGTVWQSVLWSPGGKRLALARSARTWCTVTIIETDHWTSWDFTLPDGSPIPEYTFLPDDELWGNWLDDNTLELTVGRGGDDGPQTVYDCIFYMEGGRLTGETLERTAEVLPGRWDFDHDGELETVEFMTAMYGVYELQILKTDGTLLWREEMGLPHVGYDSIFAGSIGGEDYLIRYLPTMYQGWADYHLEVFSLDETGEEQLFYRNDIEWDCNFRMEGHRFDAVALTDFLWDVRGYLENSTLLLSTEDGTLQSNIPGLQLQSYPFGETLALESREAMEAAVRQVEAEYRGEQGV